MSEEKSRRAKIVEVAIKLAQGRGFDSVGLREVAEEAGVALGSLYKSFGSKEEIIGAAVEYQTLRIRQQFDRRPASGSNPLERVEDLFTRLTRALTRRPAYTRTILGAVSANHPEITSAALQHADETHRIIVAAIRGGSPHEVDLDSYSDAERDIAFLLRHIWFASMVGWTAELYSQRDVVGHVMKAARLLLRGAALAS